MPPVAGAARDADVMVEALDGLAERYAGQVPKATFAAVRKRLEVDRRLARGLLEQGDATERVSAELREAVVRIDEWPLERDGRPAIGDGLRCGYARGRKAFMRAQRHPTDETLHAWRKRAKDLGMTAVARADLPRTRCAVTPRTLTGCPTCSETTTTSSFSGQP